MPPMSRCDSCTKKKAKNYYDCVKPQKITTELNDGQLMDDDYCGRSYDLLSSINTAVPRLTAGAEDTFHIHELHKILDANNRSIEHGFARMSDGQWYLASSTPLRAMTGEMFEWWLAHCDSSERFKWWHPTANVHGEYDPTFYAVQPEDRLVGHSIGHRFTCIRKMYSGGSCGSSNNYDIDCPGEDMMQHIDYIHPAEFINTDALASAGITACVIGRISYRDHHLGEISVGHVCHVVQERMGRTTLVSRMWLGHVDKTDDNFPPPSFVNYVGNSMLYRYFKFSNAFIKHVWIQMVQEMGCLAAFLPDFYAQESEVLEQRKQMNMVFLESNARVDEFEEFSESEEEEVVEQEVKSHELGRQYDEESLPEEESMPEDEGRKDDAGYMKHEQVRGVSLTGNTSDPYGEKSMSEGDDELYVPSSSRKLTLETHNRFYEYDTNDDDEKEGDSSDGGAGGRGKGKGASQSRREKKSSKGRGKSKKGGNVSSSSLFSTANSASSRVGKGVGV